MRIYLFPYQDLKKLTKTKSPLFGITNSTKCSRKARKDDIKIGGNGPAKKRVEPIWETISDILKKYCITFLCNFQVIQGSY